MTQGQILFDSAYEISRVVIETRREMVARGWKEGGNGEFF